MREAEDVAVPTEAESRITLLPETHAAMASYLLMPGRPKGFYATVDVGAGSTDSAFFWFYRKEDGTPAAYYYGACSRFVGMDDIDCALATPDSTPDQVRRVRLAGHFEYQSAEPQLSKVSDDVYDCYRKAFNRSYDHWRGPDKYRSPKTLRPHFTLCLVGGGSQCPPLIDRLGKALPYLNMRGVESQMLRVPGDLQVLAGRGLRPIRSVAPTKRRCCCWRTD